MLPEIEDKVRNIAMVNQDLFDNFPVIEKYEGRNGNELSYTLKEDAEVSLSMLRQMEGRLCFFSPGYVAEDIIVKGNKMIIKTRKR